jgi:hypothetical protein
MLRVYQVVKTLEEAKKAIQVQKSCTKEVVAPLAPKARELTMREAFHNFSIVEYNRSKSI